MADEKKETKSEEHHDHKEHHEEHHEHHSQKSSNVWMIATIILAIAFIILFVMIISGISIPGMSSGKTISGSDAGVQLTKFLNTKTNGGVEYVNYRDMGNLYEINVTYKNQTIPVYTDKSGRWFIQSTPVDITAAADNSTSPPPTPSGPVNISIGNSPSTGSTSAKVTVIEFSDFSCPYCEAASGYNTQMVSYMQQQSPSWQPIVTNLLKDYVQTGKVRFVSKYSFGHTGGHPASLVSWCLNDQSSDLFWKFYAKAYAHESADTENLTLMTADAKTLGADMTKLQACLDSGKYNSAFDAEQAEGTAAGVQGTPAFFINGVLHEGAVPYSEIKAAIDADLAK